MSGVPGYLFFGGCFAVMAATQIRAYRRGGGWWSLSGACAAGLIVVVQAVGLVWHLAG